LTANLREQVPLHGEFIRVYRSFTTAGYWLNRKLALNLIRLWDCCGVLHGMSSRKPDPQSCIDVAWWGPMKDHVFLAMTPLIGQIGFQRPGFSDIENRTVNYGV
jgi:hypothetical protein